MSRPTEFFLEDETVYWYVSIVDVDGTPLDADSDPTLVYRRSNGTGTTTTGVGVTKVAGTTGLYQFRHNTSLDTFLVPNTPIHYEEIAVINGVTYYNRWTSMIRSVATLANQTAVKAKTDQFAFTVANQVDANSLTGGTSAAAIYTYFTDGSREDVFKADVSVLNGSGSISYPVTVKSSGTPVAGVECWVSTDSAGSNVVAGTLTTDDFGVVTFLLDAGTYYLWRDSTTHSFPKPTTITVS